MQEEIKQERDSSIDFYGMISHRLLMSLLLVDRWAEISKYCTVLFLMFMYFHWPRFAYSLSEDDIDSTVNDSSSSDSGQA